jgi:cholest-4-en-3-one 26-monooxygenase
MTVNLPEGFDFTDPDLYAERLPYAEWAEVRAKQPVYWNAKAPGVDDGFDDDGYWVISKLDDIKDVSRRTGTDFSASENSAVPRYAPGTDRGIIVDMLGNLILNQDGEGHTTRRRIVSKGFTPRNVALLRDKLKDRAYKIVDEALAQGEGDFITYVASELPLQTIAEMIGVPQEDRHKLFSWSNLMTSYDVPELSEQATEAATELLAYAYMMAEDRAVNPQDDLVTKLIQADVDGEKLSSEEFGWFVAILAVAGNETTRNATTHGMRAFLDNPDQWELFKKERPETAYAEILRWASPVTCFQRTAMHDTTVRGVEIKKGQRLVMFYGSANFDEEHFEDPFTFNIMRENNPHITFGGQGPHYCLGANLARLQIELIFTAIADRLPDLSSLGDASRVRSGWLNGITTWPTKFDGCPVAH